MSVSSFLAQLDEEYRNSTAAAPVVGIGDSAFLSQLETEYKENMLSKARSGELPALSSVRQFEITPEMHQQAMSRLTTQPSYVRPEDTLTEAEPPATDVKGIIEEGVASFLRGTSNVINGMLSPSNREAETLKWLAGLDDAQVREAVMKGQIDDRYRRYVMLPQAERQEAIQRALAGQEQYQKRLNAATGLINSESREVGGAVAQTVNKGLEMVPGVAASLAKYHLLGPLGWVAQNTLSGNAAAREKVFANQIAQGKTVPEAAAVADSLGWNAADIATRGATDAATMAAFGAAPNLYGGLSPALQRAINAAKGAGVSGLGAAGENVIGSAWGGRDIDPMEAAKAGAGAAAATGLFGLLNMALNAGKIHGEHKTWRTIRDFNNIVKDYGVTPLSPDTSLRDAAEFTENVITSGQLPPDKAMEMLTRLGLSPEQAAAQVQRLSRQGSLEGPDMGATDFRGQYADTVMDEYGANTQVSRALPQGGAPGATRDETARRNSNLWNIVNSGQRARGAEAQRTALGFLDRYGVNVMGQKPLPGGGQRPQTEQQPQLPAPEPQAEEPKGALASVVEAAKPEPEEPEDKLKEWVDDHVIIGVVGRPEPKPAETAQSGRYTLESGKPLSEGAEDDFVLKDGQRAWGRVTEELSDGREDVPVGDVRVKVGRPGVKGMGLLHAKGHEQDFINTKFKNAEDYLEHTLGNFNLIVPVGDGKHFVAVDTNQPTSPSAVLAWREEDGGYYDLISAYPARRRTINSQKKKSLSTGRPTPAPAPAPAPSAMDTAISSKPESDATVAYGDNDLSNNNIPQQAEAVKEPGAEPASQFQKDILGIEDGDDNNDGNDGGATAPKVTDKGNGETPKPKPTTIPEGAKLKGGDFTVHYEGSTGPKDYEIRAKPWEKHNKRYIYLDELREGNTPKPVGYYDVSKDKFVKKKDNFFVDEVEKEFRKRLGDFFEEPKPLGTINPKTGLHEITIDLSPNGGAVNMTSEEREDDEEAPKPEAEKPADQPKYGTREYYEDLLSYLEEKQKKSYGYPYITDARLDSRIHEVEQVLLNWDKTHGQDQTPDEAIAGPEAKTGTGKSPSMKVAERVASHMGDIHTGDHKTWPAKIETDSLIKMADEAFGGTLAKNDYTIKDAYDALEMGVNKSIQNGKISPSDDINDIARDLDKLRIMEAALPTQAKRTEEQNEFQQFSTPPRIAYIANWLSGVGKDDVVLEPSAGVGGLAVFAKNAGATVVMNELSDRRRELLKEMGLGEVLEDEQGHGYNAEHIHDILPDDAVRPTKVIMNPPFSSTAGRMKGKKNDTKNATLHVEQALNRLEEGGRLVAILGKGMNDEAPAFRDWWRDIKKRYNVRANVLLNGREYRKYGTSFGNAIVVIDKNGPTPEGGTVTGSFDTVADMASSKELQQLRADAPKPEAKAKSDTTERGDDAAYFVGIGGGERLIPEDADLKKDFRPGTLYVKYSDRGGEHEAEVSVTMASKSSIGFREVGARLGDNIGFYNVPNNEFSIGAAQHGYTSLFEAVVGAFTRHISNFYNPSKQEDTMEVGSEDKPKTRFPKYQKKKEEEEAKEPEATGNRAWVHPSGLFVGNFPEGQDTVEIKIGSPEDGIFGAKQGHEPKAETKKDKTEKEESETKQEPAEPTVKIERKTEEERQAERTAGKGKDKDLDVVFDSYKPSKIKIKGAKHHPADLVESAAMASVSMPDVTYSPHLPENVIADGLLSEEQLEAVTYAGQAFTKINKDGMRRGFFIGDGTGLGKGREICGVIMDQMAQGHGNGKAVWISNNHDLLGAARRDWVALGNDGADVFPQTNSDKKEKDGTASDKDIKRKNGVCFTAYSMIRDKDKVRLEQLKKWLGKDFDGVIALDECHNANNAMDAKGERGTKHASLQSNAVKDLVRAFPNARVLYVSATGGTEVRNLAMLDRLGLWGEGTPFEDVNTFVGKISAGGTAAMEMVARDMKAMGLFVARSLSQRAGPNGGPEDVTFSRLTHKLTEEQNAIYDKIAEAWSIVFQNMEEALKLCGDKDGKGGLGRAKSTFYSLEQRCMSQVLNSMKMPSVIKAIREDLKQDKSVVIQLTDTGDAATKRATAKLKEGDTLDDIDVSPKDTLIMFLEKSFPVKKQETYTDPDGNVKIRDVLDGDKKPVISKEAAAMRDRLIAEVESIRFPDTPLDMILNAFGTENVAEITGRDMRIVKNAEGERVREPRGDKIRHAEAADFNDGKRRILVFSEKGGTGESYHAGREFKNQQKRVHYLVQPGWKADKAVQGIGRTNRSNQAHKPHVVLAETDVPGEKRFMSSIARKLGQLGAISTGERRATTQGLFSERDNLENRYAHEAVYVLFTNLLRGEYKDIDKPVDIIERMGYKPENVTKADKTPPVSQFLNRVLALDVATQRKVFAHFEKAIDTRILYAMQNGTLDTGTENIRADKVKVLQEKVVNRDEEHGGETSYVQLEVSTRQFPQTMSMARQKGHNEFYLAKRSGMVVAARRIASETDESGSIKDNWALISPDPNYYGRAERRVLDNPDNYEKLDEEKAIKLWNEQAADVPEFDVKKKHMIVGAMLPIWDKLEASNPRIQRVMTDDGKSYLGRLIGEKELGLTLARLNIDYKGEETDPAEMFKRMEKLGTTATLANEWKLKTVMVNGDRRIEILGFNFYNETALKNAGAFIEMEGLSKRRFFIPMGNTDVMKRIMDISPVARIKARDILGDAADVINADIPEGVGENLNFIHPWFAAKAEAMENPLMDVAEGAMNVSSDPEVNERARASEEGVKPLSGWDEVKHAVRQFVHGFSGDYPELAVQESESGVDLKPARELIRKMNREIQAQTQKAVKLLDGLLKPMSARGYDTFRWAWIMMDLKYQKSDMPDSLLPYGWTDEQFEKDFNKWMERAEKMPNVKQAIERMEEITADMAGNLASAFHAIGWHSAANRFRNPHYFHHVVLEFANVLASTQGKHNHGKAPDNRSWLKRRKGSDKDISANFIQVTGEYLTQAFQDIASCKMLKEIKDKYDIIEQVKREAFMTNEGNVIKQIYEGMKKVDKFTLEHPTDEQMWADAESLFRKTFNQKQAKALSRLFELAKRGDLPEGEFGDVVDAMEAAGSVEDLPETMRKRFNRYLGWLAGLGGDDAGTLSARGYFKGVADKKKQIKATLGDEFLDWRDLVPEGYTVWDPFNNPLVISVNTVPEYIMKLAEQENLQDIHIALADLVKMKVIGGHRQLWVIPTEIAATLDRLGKRKPRGKGGVVARRISSLWKKNVLYNPWRVLKSNLRNFTSDLDAAVAGNPKILAYLPRAVKELTDLFFRGRAATGDLRDFQERGGALTAESVQELYDWKNMREFKHLAPKEQEKLLKRMAHIGSGYMEWAETVTQWRESWLRYAAYLHYMEDMRKNGGIPTSWGASKPEEVMALKDIRDRAYKMANELLGAYDQVSQTTRGMREWVIPFMSWKEVNFRRVLQMFRNTAQGRSWIEAEVRKILGGGGGKGPNDPTGGKAAFDGGDDRFHWTSLLGFAMRTPTIALRMAMTLATNFWFWGMMYLYNNMLHHDEEQSLPPDLQNRPHVITESDPTTGDVFYFDRIGALPDFLENFGLDQFATDLRQIWNGQKTWAEFLTQIPKGIISTGWNSLSPLIKIPAEGLLGRTGFPDVFKPRQIRDIIDYLASGLALKWPVSAIRSLAEDKPGPGFWSIDHLRDFGSYTARPKLEAYYYILDLKRQFQEGVLGKTFDGFASTKRGKALGYAKTAMRYGDMKKASRWIDRYYELDGTWQGFKTSVRNLDPLAGLTKEEQADFEDWLSPQDKKYLDMAYDYYDDMSDKLYDAEALAGTD